MAEHTTALTTRPDAQADEVRLLCDAARAGDRAAAAELGRRCVQDPGLVQALGGDLQGTAVASLIEAITDDPATRTALYAKVVSVRRQLADDDATPVERLLAARAAVCWLWVQHADAVVAQAQGISIGMADHLQRRQDRAHRRYLAALKTLAVVRRLALPAIQVNLGAQQINQVNVAKGATSV